MTQSSVVLIHSPLVGPFTWALTAEKMRVKGVPVILPTLISDPGSIEPYWKAHANAVARALRAVPESQPVLLVGHSGAGPLLPAIRQAISHPLSGYLFVDAGWPEDGKSRLDLFEDEEAVDQFRQNASGGLLPTWSDADLRSLIPNDSIRRRFVQELEPLPLAVYEEKLPVFPGWPDAPVGYLRFGSNPAYDHSYAQAQRSGCACAQLKGEHFHMLVDPEAVAQELVKLAAQMGVSLTGSGG